FLIGLVPALDFSAYGIVPRTFDGLIGIVAAPFLHASWSHLLSNTVPLTLLLILLAGSSNNSVRVVLLIVLLGGALLWLFGRHANHIGASLLIYGLVTYLMVSGVFERRFIPLAV